MKKALIVVLLLVSAASVLADLPAYTITDLGPLVARAINDNGQIAGMIRVEWNWHAGLYDGAIIHDLGTLDGGQWSWSFAHDINNSGHVVGWSDTADNLSRHAFYYDGTLMHDLGGVGTVDGQESSSWAYAVNNSGQVVGHSSDHAFLYDGSIMYDLGTLGGRESTAFGINDNGQIVGYSKITGNSAYHAFLYDEMAMYDIGTLGGTYSVARAINNSSQIVGRSTIADNSAYHAFLYDGITMHDLGTLGDASSEALSINENGQIVGRTWIGESNYHAFLYDGDIMIYLNDLIPSCSGWELMAAADINNSGQIIGTGTIHGDDHHSFLMTPIPETTTQLYLDIKPGRCPNPLNVGSQGVLPMAILGTEFFDINEIDVASIDLFGIGPIQSEYTDSATVLSDPNDCRHSTVGPDGYMDLTLKFDTQVVVDALGEVVDGEEWLFELTGSLYDGTLIIGQDCVVIKKKGK